MFSYSYSIAIIPDENSGRECIVTQCICNLLEYDIKSFLSFPFETVVVRYGWMNQHEIFKRALATDAKEAEKNHYKAIENILNGIIR